MGGTWEQAKAAALAQAAKLKAKNVKIPEPKVSYSKFASDIARLSKEYDTAVAALQAKIVAMKQQCGTIRPALEMFDDQIEKNNFNINPKDTSISLGAGMPYAPQLIDEMRDKLSTFIAEKLKSVDAISKILDGAEKNAKVMDNLDLDP